MMKYAACRKTGKALIMGGKSAAKDCAHRRDLERSRRKAAALRAEIIREGCFSFPSTVFQNVLKA